MRIIPFILALFASLFAKDLVPSKTHAVLNISYTNFQDVPQAHKKLVFVGQKNPNRKITVKTDQYGEASFLIPKKIPTISCAKVSQALLSVVNRLMFQ